MIVIGAILLLSSAFIAGLAMYWRKILGWIQKAVNKIKEVLGVAVKGTRTFIERTAAGLQNKAKHYNENKMTGEWEESVFTKNIEESEVPPEILAKIRAEKIGVEVSTTEELKLVVNA